ncbi:hypothetical protein AOQ73_06095 [Bradyrhizobium pachyrhizi]|uniref:phosphatase domain-containing protein n=1 Tax=Bradyrhizobium pachyrhizi TaxID=280333 RepID=UPI000704E5B6|nr:HAD family acid phosphatase [Bradyrhizobium pachyrhizi]KRQ11644.1 hypothetical protein AOQ73_06095 [Bradyrhizobium pachyrhizi]
MTKRVYVFDIDGTVADTTHRQHHISGERKNWDAFFAACDQDAPIPHMVELANTLAGGGDDIIFATGRSEDVREKTLTWLRGQFGSWIFPEDVYMRKAGDHRADTIVKAELLEEIRADGWEPIMVFEDRASVVTMWRELGIPCCQVAPGDF